MAIPFIHEMDITHGKSDRLSPLVRRVVAPNPGPFTFRGTNTYIVGAGKSVAVIDPGPLLDAHMEALAAAIGSAHVSHIFVTHTHNDHSPLAEPLKAKYQTQTYGFGPHGSGKRLSDMPAMEEGGDRQFTPDHRVKHGDIITGDGFAIESVFTPGHTSNHMCFALREEKRLFTGDHIMSWSTSVVVPPDGHMGAYMESLALLLKRDDEIYCPGHGEEITKPKSFVRAFITHRRQREARIRLCLEEGVGDIRAMVAQIYQHVDKQLQVGRSTMRAMAV